MSPNRTSAISLQIVYSINKIIAKLNIKLTIESVLSNPRLPNFFSAKYKRAVDRKITPVKPSIIIKISFIVTIFLYCYNLQTPYFDIVYSAGCPLLGWPRYPHYFFKIIIYYLFQIISLEKRGMRIVNDLFSLLFNKYSD